MKDNHPEVGRGESIIALIIIIGILTPVAIALWRYALR